VLCRNAHLSGWAHPAILGHEDAGVVVDDVGRGVTSVKKGDHVVPLADINKAFDLMHKGESIRSIVAF